MIRSSKVPIQMTSFLINSGNAEDPSADGPASKGSEPKARGGTVSQARGPDAADAPKAISADPKPARLLILDDDPLISRVISRSAERSGFQAAAASNPGDFFLKILQWQPSHVAIDLSMPQMSGLQVIESLAKMGCSARIIVSSGCDTGAINQALAQARTLGLSVAGALPKPFSLPALRSLLELDAPSGEA